MLRSLWCSVLLAAILAGAGCAPVLASPAGGPASPEARYRDAIRDAAVLHGLGLEELFVPRADSTLQVRVVAFTSWPGYADSARLGRDSFELERDVWVTLVPEVRDSCARFARGELGLEVAALLGLPPGAAGGYFAEFQVPLAALFRPTADPTVLRPLPCADASAGVVCATRFPAGTPAEHYAFIAGTALFNWREDGGYPWTRLGYTYNWRAGAPPYGASEYVARGGTRLSRLAIHRAEEYCQMPRRNG